MNAEFLAWYGPLCSLLFGLCVGSFLNVCIYRNPRELSIVRPRSFCPGCGNTIAWYDNIPVMSYLVLRGRCRRCRAVISPRYPLIELLTGFLFVLAWHVHGVSAWTPVLWVMLSGLVVATMVDFDHMIIPDGVSLGGMVFGLAASALVPELHGTEMVRTAMLRSALGLAAGSGILWLVSVVGRWVFKKDAMGLGDVKLLGAIGTLIGVPGVIYTILISSLLGTVVGIAMILFGGHQWRSRLPYGPYLAIAAGSWTLGGEQLWRWYINLIGVSP